MRTAIACLALLVLAGCGNPRTDVPLAGPDAEYLDGIAKGKSDECRTTYALILERREAAVPVILKALDLYADPAKAPRPKTLILNGTIWACKMNPAEARPAVVDIMRKAVASPNPDVSSSAKAWLQADEKAAK
jgi:hypothetical protein